jgi:hypothetical protein
MAQTIYISDTSNNRIIERAVPSLDYMGAISNIPGYGTFQPYGICNDGTYLYFLNRNNNNLVKCLLGNAVGDLTWVSSACTTGSGDNNLSDPWGMCTDNTYLYIADFGNSRIMVRMCNDLSYFGKISTYTKPYFGTPQAFSNARSITTDGTYFYVPDFLQGYGSWIAKFSCVALTQGASSFAGLPRISGVDIDGSNFYISYYDRFV